MTTLLSQPNFKYPKFNWLIRKNSGLLTVCMILGAFAFQFGASSVAHAEDEWHKVKILGYVTGPNGLTFQVPTGGCLQKSHFNVRVIREGDAPVVLQLMVNKVDECRRSYPYGTTIRFSYSEIGIEVNESFTVNNGSGVATRAGYAERFDTRPAGGASAPAAAQSCN
jgi:hypothetical protein